jgi:diphthamide synthase (EF-2-diphthine--ammonia ligase)
MCASSSSGSQPGAPCHALNVRYGWGMSDTTPKIETDTATATPPELEVARSCMACGGDVAVRFTGKRATGLCRKCGFVSHSFVHQHDGHVVFEQILRAAA